MTCELNSKDLRGAVLFQSVTDSVQNSPCITFQALINIQKSVQTYLSFVTPTRFSPLTSRIRSPVSKRPLNETNSD